MAAGAAAGGLYGRFGAGSRPPGYVPPQTSGTSSADPRRKSTTKSSTGDWTETSEYGPSTEDELKARDKYNALAEGRRMASIQGLMGGFGGSGGGAGGAGGGGGQIAFNEQGARDAAFARAKDRQGQTSRAAMDSLRGALSSSGRLGGQFEAEKTAQVIGEAAGGLGEFERDQMMMDLNRAGQISDRNVQADLTRRGQDLQRQAALLGLFNVTGAIY